MSNERSLVFTEGLALQTGPDVARLVSPYHETINLVESDLGLLAEWLAVAWVNVTGEEYQHQEVGIPVNTQEYTEVLRVERDCE